MLYILAIVPLLFCLMLIDYSGAFKLLQTLDGSIFALRSEAQIMLTWITMCVCTSLVILALAIRK